MSGLENVKASSEIRGDKVSTLMFLGWWKETFPKNGSRIKTYGRQKHIIFLQRETKSRVEKVVFGLPNLLGR
jgi:hypothetical protein